MQNMNDQAIELSKIYHGGSTQKKKLGELYSRTLNLTQPMRTKFTCCRNKNRSVGGWWFIEDNNHTKHSIVRKLIGQNNG
jgi:hypothetical protein